MSESPVITAAAKTYAQFNSFVKSGWVSLGMGCVTIVLMCFLIWNCVYYGRIWKDKSKILGVNTKEAIALLVINCLMVFVLAAFIFYFMWNTANNHTVKNHFKALGAKMSEDASGLGRRIKTGATELGQRITDAKDDAVRYIEEKRHNEYEFPPVLNTTHEGGGFYKSLDNQRFKCSKLGSTAAAKRGASERGGGGERLGPRLMPPQSNRGGGPSREMATLSGYNDGGGRGFYTPRGDRF